MGYTPRGWIVGLSRLTRLVECFSKRLQVQPLSVGGGVRCRHMCMESRGIRTSGQETVTSAMLGAMQTNFPLRTAFLALAREKD